MVTGIPWAAWAATALLADVLVAPHLSVLGARPDFAVTAIALSWMAKDREADPVVTAWATGLGRDVLSIGPPGLHAVSFALVALLAGPLRKDWFTEHLPTRFATVACAVAAQALVCGILGRLTQAGPALAPWAWFAVGSGIFSAGLGVFGPALVLRVRKWFRDAFARLAWS